MSNFEKMKIGLSNRKKTVVSIMLTNPKSADAVLLLRMLSIVNCTFQISTKKGSGIPKNEKRN